MTKDKQIKALDGAILDLKKSESEAKRQVADLWTQIRLEAKAMNKRLVEIEGLRKALNLMEAHVAIAREEMGAKRWRELTAGIETPAAFLPTFSLVPDPLAVTILRPNSFESALIDDYMAAEAPNARLSVVPAPFSDPNPLRRPDYLPEVFAMDADKLKGLKIYGVRDVAGKRQYLLATSIFHDGERRWPIAGEGLQVAQNGHVLTPARPGSLGIGHVAARADEIDMAWVRLT